MAPDVTLWNHGEEPQQETLVACPACTETLIDLLDLRFGYCPTCRAFTCDPTDFIIESDMSAEELAGWRARVREQTYRVLTEGSGPLLDPDVMFKRDVNQLRAEYRIALSVPRPASFVVPGESDEQYRARQRRGRWRRRWLRFTRCWGKRRG